MDKSQGFIKLWRSLKDKSFYNKDSEKVHLWIHLMIKATHTGKEEMLGGKPIKCLPGQFTTGRKQLSKETGISESKIERILTFFNKIEQQIEQQKTNTNRLISILNWDNGQKIEQQIEQQLNNDRTTTEQQLNTLQERKNVKKVKKVKNIIPPNLEMIKNYCRERNNGIDINKFFDFYESKGWMVGKNKMKDWQATIRTWEKSESKKDKPFIVPILTGNET